MTDKIKIVCKFCNKKPGVYYNKVYNKYKVSHKCFKRGIYPVTTETKWFDDIDSALDSWNNIYILSIGRYNINTSG